MVSLSDDQLEALLDGRVPPAIQRVRDRWHNPPSPKPRERDAEGRIIWWRDKHGNPIYDRFIDEEQMESLPELTAEEVAEDYYRALAECPLTNDELWTLCELFESLPPEQQRVMYEETIAGVWLDIYSDDCPVEARLIIDANYLARIKG
jgi:hypothetical protein